MASRHSASPSTALLHYPPSPPLLLFSPHVSPLWCVTRVSAEKAGRGTPRVSQVPDRVRHVPHPHDPALVTCVESLPTHTRWRAQERSFTGGLKGPLPGASVGTSSGARIGQCVCDMDEHPDESLPRCRLISLPF